jgi:pimeloyl-ACP methyl ester carboxylesterase
MKTSSFKIPGMHLTNHEFDVPINYKNAEAGSLRVFAREVVSNANYHRAHELPWLIFFQGGPGFPSPRPVSKHGWIARALQHYRLLLLDQRGTGLSSPITYQTLKKIGSAKEQAAYLTNFRADSIVKDAEFIRSKLLKPGEKWTGFGQSYGGFCLTHYLSAAPEGLAEVVITGGLPPLTASVDDIYRATYKRVLNRNKQYYDRYPMDTELVRKIVAILRSNEVLLPDGGTLTPERFQQLGIIFGMSEGFEAIHYLLEEALVNNAHGGDELSYTFLRNLANAQAYETNPIYALLHESIYCQNFASNWSAERMKAEFQQFSPDRSDGPLLFTGEMIYPSMFDDYKYLQPLKSAAEILAQKADWEPLYDVKVLRKNTVPVAAAVYYDDMYVELSYSQETAETIGNVRTWVTNEYDHNGIRQDGERVLDRLFQMLRGEI